MKIGQKLLALFWIWKMVVGMYCVGQLCTEPIQWLKWQDVILHVVLAVPLGLSRIPPEVPRKEATLFLAHDL